ncbi:MAG: hypothetical protein CVV44_02505 [Spirochaetae bacterium HGW-Spirochaetae-1]|jgi:hypothetical protein|nr:MAG: hypothetical protein CVV44_02505 [Spirochaetae bacterium HGW-Spirochaetae-1]
MKTKKIIKYFVIIAITLTAFSCFDLADDLEDAASRGKITSINGLTLEGNRDALYDDVNSYYSDAANDSRSATGGMDIAKYYLAQDNTYLWIYVSFNDGNPVAPGSGISCYYIGYISADGYGEYQLCVDYDIDSGSWSARLDNVLDQSNISIPVSIGVGAGLELRINKAALPFNIFEFDFSTNNYDDNTAIRKYWFD